MWSKRAHQCSCDILRDPRRLMAVASLALLFLFGPLHVWHHSSASNDHSGASAGEAHCVPCSAFQKTLVIAVGAAALAWVGICLGEVQPVANFVATPIDLTLLAGRAPPQPSV